MKVRFFETKEFKKLHEKWQKELRESGFEDIEGETRFLKNKLCVAREVKNPERMRGQLEYYTMASKFLWDYKFESKKDYQIWFYHSEGMAYREIAKNIRGENVKSIFKAVNRIKAVFVVYMKAQWEFDEQEND